MLTIIHTVIIALAIMFSHVNSQTLEQVQSNMRSAVQDYLKGSKLRVATLQTAPYVESSTNSTYRGFLPDILEAMGEDLGFQTEFYIPSDKDSPGIDALLTELSTWKESGGSTGADLLAAPLSSAVSSDIDQVYLTQPIQFGGFSMLMKKRTISAGSLFSIFHPFTPSAWVVLVLMPFIVAFVIWLVHILTGCFIEVASKKEFTITGSLWFTLTSMHWQGFDRVPGPVGARVLGYTWFGFSSFMLLTYISGLVSHYGWATKAEHYIQTPDIKTLEDIVHDPDWTIDTVKDGEAEKFVQTSDVQYMHTLSARWKNVPLANDISSGIDNLLLRDNSVLLLDTPTAEYVASKHCDLAIAGESIGGHSLSLALHPTHPLRGAIDFGILGLTETGKMELLENKWFRNNNVCKGQQKLSLSPSTPVQPLNMKMMMAPTASVAVGIILGILLTGMDILCSKWRGNAAGI